MKFLELIPYIIVLMIIYDLSIHFVYLFNLDEKIIKRKLNWWFNWWGKKYQIFWIFYWLVVLVLMLIFILFNE